MTALLQFMYQGVVNVKHDELKIFMQIAASLQIKGLTAHGENNHHHNMPHTATGQPQQHQQQQPQHQKYNTGVMTPPKDVAMAQPSTLSAAPKRSHDVHHEPYPIMPKRRHPQQPRTMAELLHQVQSQQQRNHQRNTTTEQGDVSSNSDESGGAAGMMMMMSQGGGGGGGGGSNITEDVLMPAISLTESSSAFQLGHVKRESMDGTGQNTGGSPASLNHSNINNNNNNNNCATSVNQNSNKNNGPDRTFFPPPLKIEFGGVGAGGDLQDAAGPAVCYPLALNRPGLPSTPPAYKFEAHHPSDHMSIMSNESSSSSFSKSANHMDIPTGK